MSKVMNEMEKLCMKLKSADIETQQLWATLESCKPHNSRELKIMEESVNKRIQAVAESQQRTEESLKNELYKDHGEG